ncbi:MAG TPA: GNAT family N-acetyltransferase [Actinomycetota bacterium]
MELPPPLDLGSGEAVVSAIVGHDAFLITTLVRLAGVELHEESFATWYLSGVPEALFNGVVATRMTEADADRRIDELIGRFREEGVPAMWWASPLSTPRDLASRLREHGLRGTTMPGMALDLSAFAAAAVPDGLRIQVVEDAAGVDAWMEASSDAFEIVPDVRPRYRQTPEAVLAGDVPGWCVTGYWNERPVATAMVCVGTGVAGLSNIATIPSYRRRGLGAAVTSHGIELARDAGYRTAVLTSTDSGRPLYEALGFETRCTVDVFEVPPG